MNHLFSKQIRKQMIQDHMNWFVLYHVTALQVFCVENMILLKFEIFHNCKGQL